MIVRKSDGSYEEFDRKKLSNIIKKAFKGADMVCDDERANDIIDKLYVYDGIMCSSIRKQLQQRFSEIDEKVLLSYLTAKEKTNRIKDFVNEKKKFIEKYKKSDNTANATVDDNSNVASKNIGILNAEIHKSDNIEISRGMVMDKLKELYPTFRAKNYIKDLKSHIIYKHDESSFAGAISPYCVSETMYPFLTNGIKRLGGLSAAPKNIDSFCGMFVNLIFATASQFAGACLYKNQSLLINKNGLTYNTRIQDLVNEFSLDRSFNNYQGDWEYADISNMNYYVEESERKVKIKKVYRRKYNDDIYRIKTHGGLECLVSKDHKFKVLYRDRILEIPANKLQDKETLFVGIDHSCMIDKTSEDYKDGQFLGIICGDGCVTNTNYTMVTIHKEQMYIKDFLEEYFAKKFGKTGTIREDKRKNAMCGDYIVSSVEIRDKICEMLTPCERHDTFTKNVDMTNKSIDFQMGFLDGILVTDGCYCIDKGVKLSLTNEGLIDTVIQILNNINIRGVNKTGGKIYEYQTNKHPLFNIWVPSRVRKYLDLTLLKPCKSSLVRVSKRVDSTDRYLGKEVYYLGPHHAPTASGQKFICNGNSHNPKYKDYHTDVLESIELFKNDDEYVYQIETESQWYNCGGLITHNCATPEFLLYFTYFAKKEWGEEFWKTPDTVVTANTLREQTIRKQIRQYFQQVVYSINQPAAARGMQSAFWNVAYFDKLFFEGMFGNFVFPDGTKPDWESLEWIQQEFMQWFNEERSKCILTFPVESFALVYKDGKFQDEKSFDFVAEEYARGHSFFTYISDTVDSLSSCCRLKNKLQTREFNFTNGNMGVQTGSKSVITLNLNRITQDWFNSRKDKDSEFKFDGSDKQYDSLNAYMNKILERVYKYHTAYNELLWDMYDANLLPVYKAGFIDLNKQYLTIGINGLNQAAEFLGLTCRDNEEYSRFCQKVFGNIKEKNTLHKVTEGKHKITFNTECVPAESLAVKNYNWDKEDGYVVPSDTNLYASYIYKPNDKEVSMLEKIRLHGSRFIGEFLDGGSAAHLNSDSHMSKEQYAYLLKYAADNGCQYLTWNIPNCECEDCHYISKTPFDVCPHCGSKNVAMWDRIIGYLTQVKNWSEGRKIEQKTRVYEHFEGGETC